ncbi:MAG: excinuclease ABC subunit UvrC [Nitrospirota bacterium]|nr:excinuclease ABC subunit UvrC [Nitrospirota bacterium]
MTTQIPESVRKKLPESVPEKLRETLRHLPELPGVYLMHDAVGKVLYVGKAKSLKNRVRSYFLKDTSHTPRTRVMVRKIARIETIITASEVEALVLENNLIKRHRPQYNVMLRDDKNYPYIRLSVQDAFPRLTVVRRAQDDGARYYGPYVGAGAMRETLRVIHNHFPLADCDIVIDGTSDRPCLQYQIGRCRAPCTGFQGAADYAATVREVRMFLEGHDRELVNLLTTRMQAASDALQFEQAARLRDQIYHIQATLTRQRITAPGGGDVDIYGLARLGGWLALQVLFVREGALVGSKGFVWEELSDMDGGEVVCGFIQQFYDGRVPVPAKILLPMPVPDEALLAEWLGARRNAHSGKKGKCVLESPARGRGMALLQLAAANAEKSLTERLEAEKAGERGLVALQKTLHLDRLPHRIEGFDISHIQGELTVASMVVWEGAGPKKSDYRHFRIRTTDGPDDFAAMREVVRRHYTRLREAGMETGQKLPDLILIDGGRGQLSMALKALHEAGIPPPPGGPAVVALAKEKGEKFERVFRPGVKNPGVLKPGAPATRILQQLRDEAHRFAITYHRKLRSLRLRDSELDGIAGVGKVRKQALLKNFGSVEGLRGASLEDITAAPGMNRTTAEAVWTALHPAESILPPGPPEEKNSPDRKKAGGGLVLTRISPKQQ